MLNHPFHLRGKRVLVTGASSGIGRAVAIECARAGAAVIASGRDQTRLDATMARLEEGAHDSFAADLTDDAQLAALAAHCGHIDGVVHCAGVDGVTPVRMLRAAFLDRVFDANFMAPILLTQKLLYQKALRNGASILYVSSIAAHTGTVGVGPYSASKAALEGLMRCLALEVAPRSMRVNALAPGLVDTPLVNEDRAWLEEKAASYPMGIGRPEDVAYAAIYLLCDASRKVTGTTLHLDGGNAWT
ncbi:SDR family NAD(P)-dependent oxidoreductase [Massilia sp. PWRC2]|uniref:SDR family NAD(P)-dependent oxidoreductase n=1 Tax=Massilia sp. PWRC2 TaxID=2804626 RepID=UPI003CF4400F